jgi:DNA-binding response OmpR family regulator
MNLNRGETMGKILIVEDDKNTRDLLAIIVENAGFQVKAVEDGRKALAAVRADPPDLLILDIMLPEVHGFSVCFQVKGDENLKKVKVLMLSAKAFTADRRQAEEVGADAFMTKPVKPQDLVEKIQTLLGTSSPGTMSPGTMSQGFL